MPYNCIIIDDEPPALKILEGYVEMVPLLNHAGSGKNAFEAFTLLNSQKVDLMFLDIQMPKLNGTELMKTLNYPPKVIFTTAHKDFAVDAFELDAVDYLLKPISFQRFMKAVNKFCQNKTSETESTVTAPGFLYFRYDRKMVKVFLDEILYIESFRDYMVIHRQNDAPLRIKQTLNSVETMLPNNRFLRIHRSYLVSLDKITAFTKNDVEIGKTELPIGKRYIQAFKKLNLDQLNLPEGVEDREQ